MAKRSDTISTLFLYMDLMRRVPRAPSRITSTELRESVQEKYQGLTRRRVDRAMKALSDNELLLRDARSEPYGYSWSRDMPVLVAPQMDQHESLFFMLAQKHLSNVLPEQLSSALAPFFNHARDQFHISLRDSVAKDWLDKVEIVSPTMDFIPPRLDPEILNAVTSCLYSDHRLKVRYRNMEDEVKDHVLMPLGLVQKTPFLYLVAYFDNSTEKAYTFAMHRMQSADATTLRFDRPNFDLHQYCREDRYMFGTGKQVVVDFFVTKYVGLQLQESPLSADQQIEKVGDEYHVRATVYDSRKLSNFIASLGDEIRDVKKIPVKSEKESA